jgi:hypothetical protein
MPDAFWGFFDLQIKVLPTVFGRVWMMRNEQNVRIKPDSIAASPSCDCRALPCVCCRANVKVIGVPRDLALNSGG